MNPLRKFYLNEQDRHHRWFMRTYAKLTTHKLYKGSSFDIKPLTSDQKKQVDDLYVKNFGKKISYKGHEMYTSFSGVFNPNYIPRDIYYSDIECLFNNNNEYGKVLEDKNFLPLYAKSLGVKTPKTIWSNSDGLNYVDGGKFLSRADIVEILKNVDSLFIKPSVGTSGGAECNIYRNFKHDEDSINSLLDEIDANYGANYVVQQAVVNCAELKQIHPSSLNTFRVITYILDGQVKHMPCSMRMGRGGAFVDNTSAGGIVVGINDDGILLEKAFSDKLDFVCTKHPDTGYVFSEHRISSFEKVIEAAEMLHRHIPQIKIVNWDFTIDEDNEPVLIEANCEFAAGYDLVQIAHSEGPFGKDTKKVLRMARELGSARKLNRNEIYSKNGFWN